MRKACGDSSLAYMAVKVIAALVELSLDLERDCKSGHGSFDIELGAVCVGCGLNLVEILGGVG